MGKFNRKIATLLACVSGISSIGVNFNSMAVKEKLTIECEGKQQDEEYLLFGEKEYKDLIDEFRDKEDKNASEESILTRNNVFRDDDGKIVYGSNMSEWDVPGKGYGEEYRYKLIVNGEKSPVYNKFQRHPVLDKIDELTKEGCQVYKLPFKNRVMLFTYVKKDSLCRLYFNYSDNTVSCVPLRNMNKPSKYCYCSFYEVNSSNNLPLVSDNKQMLHEIRMTGKFSKYKPGILDYMEEYPKTIAGIPLLSLGLTVELVNLLKDQGSNDDACDNF